MADEESAQSVHYVPIRELPDTLTHEAHEQIRRHAVSLVAADDDEVDGTSCAGTFVRLEKVAGILTARHVWDAIRKRAKLILMVDGRPYRIPSTDLPTALSPSPCAPLGERPVQVPDIALVPLSATHITAIEARNKAFYSIDRRVGDERFDLFGDNGFWTVVGCPKSLLDAEKRLVGSFVYDTSIERTFAQGAWDYIVINLNADGNPEIPKEFSGMSGGGLWRCGYQMKADRSRFWFDNPNQDIVLAGVTFFETGIVGRQLIAHGSRSIYQSLPRSIGE